MERPFNLGVVALALALPLTASAQSAPDGPLPITTTASGTTGIWFVPTGDVLSSRQWSVSFYRTNNDDGQGFSDSSLYSATLAYGIGSRVELFGDWRAVVNIDRDTRPLFFESADAAEKTGTGGGILLNYPRMRNEWTGNRIGDLWLGGKIRLLGAEDTPAALAISAAVKAPVGDSDGGVASGKTDFRSDLIVSTADDTVKVSAYSGLMLRGNPTGYDLANGLRWGVGAAFPQRSRLRVTAELFGEKYLSALSDNAILAPPGQFGSDGSHVPEITSLRSPAVVSLGLNWQASNGLFIGTAVSWNLHMEERTAARCAPGTTCAGGPFTSQTLDDVGLQIRLGFHPARPTRVLAAAPLPPPLPPPTVAPPPPPIVVAPPPPVVPPAPPANRPPTISVACTPCVTEVGKTVIVSVDANDADGDPLAFRWTSAAGVATSPGAGQTVWTASRQPGSALVFVEVDDGRGGMTRGVLAIDVVATPVTPVTFPDIQFDLDNAALGPNARRRLLDAVAVLRANPALRLEIQGHAGNRGRPAYNLRLSRSRAVAVRGFLVRQGIAARRLSAVAMGESRPKYDNSQEATRRLNRRVELHVIGQ